MPITTIPLPQTGLDVETHPKLKLLFLDVDFRDAAPYIFGNASQGVFESCKRAIYSDKGIRVFREGGLEELRSQGW